MPFRESGKDVVGMLINRDSLRDIPLINYERPHVTARAEEPNNALWPRGSRSLCRKRGALSDHQRLIRRRGVTPLMYQYGEM